jgi:lambda family phage portal protein
MRIEQTWLDRAALKWAPSWQLRRLKSRITAEVAMRHYEGAATGRRTQGWQRSSADAAQATGPFLARLRENVRDLVRNNPYAESALSTIADHTVGWGIVAKPRKPNKRAADVWREWAETTACDADGRHDIYGLQKLVMRAVVADGEVLVRRRLRRPEDGLPIPMQLQVLEADFLDTSKDTLTPNNGGRRIVQGVEYDALGKRAAYWLFKEHPGSSFATTESVAVPAENILHIFEPDRPGQVRGVSWFAAVLLLLKDLDEFEDATLVKQKIAACLSVLTTDVDGTAPPLGSTDTTADPQIDSLEPGWIGNLPPGREVTVVNPPTVREYPDYVKTRLRAVATGLGVSYEDLTGDYGDMPFSAARMSRIRHWSRVEDWRWRLLIPQFCDPVWAWSMAIAGIFGAGEVGPAEWTAPPAPMIDPVNEGLAYQRNVRAGIMSLSEALRERGRDPQQVFEEMASDNKTLDKLGLILDSDPRQMTQAGQLQGKALPKEPKAEKEPVAAVADELEEAARVLRMAGGRRK